MTAIGTALPEYGFDQSAIADFMVQQLDLKDHEARWLNQVYEASGIQRRHSVLPDFDASNQEQHLFNSKQTQASGTQKRMDIYREKALSLAENAITKAIQEHGQIRPQEFTHLITVSCTGLYAPGLDIDLIQSLDMDPSTERTGVHFMGCYAMFNALKTARHITRSEPNAKVLVIAVELCSLHFQQSKDKNQMVTSALFSDGAAAAIIEQKPHQTGLSMEITGFQCGLAPGSKSAMTWDIGDEGFLMHLSGSVPGHIQKALQPVTERLLDQADITFNQIPQLAPHPGGIKILEAIESELNYTPEQNQSAREVLANYGNMSSPTVLFVLANALYQKKGTLSHDDHLLSMAFGPGLTLEAGLFRIHANDKTQVNETS